MSDKSEWENLSSEKRLDLTKLSRALIRGSIIEDAATRFMAMCLAEAVAKQKAKTADEIEALRAENERLREALVAHNDILRSAFAIADREGVKMLVSSTNWDAFYNRALSILRRYHEITNAARAALNERKET